MNTKTQLKSPCNRLRRLVTATGLMALAIAPSSFGANAAWTNAPVSTDWSNPTNWVSKVVPGTINNTANNGIDGGSIAFFTNPITTFGGAANPIVPDDATVANGKARMLGQIFFDGPNCGAYVFNSPSPYAAQTGTTPETGVLSLCVPAAINNKSTNGMSMSAVVTQPQNFLIPVQIRLPSSDDGVYGFTNNATSTQGTLYFNNLFVYPGATGRGVLFVFSGSNTGTNTVVTLSENLSTAANGGVRKEGTGRWIFAGPNTIKANQPVTIVGGTLEVKDPGALGASTGVSVANSGVLQIDNLTPAQATIGLNNGGTILANGLSTVNGITIGNQVGTVVTLATTAPTDVMSVGAAAFQPTGGSADTVAHITGPGTVLLAVSSSYIGKWSVDSGTNQLLDPLALGTGNNLTLNAGATFDTSLFGAGTYQLTTKAITANGTGTAPGIASTLHADPGGIIDLLSRSINLTYTPTTTNGDLTHPALYLNSGTLACGGNAVTVNNASGVPLNVGTYQLIHAVNPITVSGTFATFVTGAGLAPGLVAEALPSGQDIVLTVYPYTPQILTWTGTDPLLPSQWDRLMSTNWLAGATPSVFNIYDIVTFNATGAANPNVNIVGTVEPGSIVVNTAGGNYNFVGTGQIAAGASLTKIGTGTLNVSTLNNYSGGTVVSNGVLQIGVANAVPDTGSGDFTVYSPGTLDMNSFDDSVNGLNGNGTVDVTSGGVSTLSIGLNDDNGTFSGLLENSTGVLNLAKFGLGTEILNTSNGLSGNASIATGTLFVTNLFALGFGQVAITNGTLDLGTNLNVGSIAGTGGSITNSQNINNSRLFVQGASTVNSLIGGKVALTVVAGTTRLNAANTYTGGSTVASGAGLAFGSGAANAGTASIVASNTATLSQPNTGSSSSAPNTPINTVDGATVTFTSSSTANTWAGQFTGSALATNNYSGGNMSISGSNSFSGFLGTVLVTGGEVRWFNAASGGDNTIFDFEGTGGSFARDNVDNIHFGALTGNGVITAPSVSFPANYVIGAKPINSDFYGSISGSNNIVKIGTNTLTLNGSIIITNTDGATFTNLLYSDSLITYLGNTTISNGVLALVVPTAVTNSPFVILSGTNAVLDATQMGYVSNQISVDDLVTPTNSFLVTNGTFTVPAITPAGIAQTLGGFGVVKGLVVDNGIIAPGLTASGGTLSLSNNLIVNTGASLNFDLSDDPTGLTKPNDLLIVSSNIQVSGSITIGINALNGGIRSGIYPLIKYSGTLQNESGIVPNGPISNFVLGGPYAALPGTLTLSNSPGQVLLIVSNTAARTLTWTGDGISNVWDVATSYSWSSGGFATNFYQLDSVRFDDSGGTNPTVYLSGGLAPASLVVSNSNVYSFGSNGTIISLTSLIKQGSGTLILSNGANSYTGGTIISNGVLNVGADSGGNQNDQALSTGAVNVNGATAELRFGGNAGNIVNHFVTNPITMLNGGIVKAQDGVQHLTNSTITLGAGGGVLQTVFSTKDLVLDSPLVGAGNLTVSVPTGFVGGRVVLNHGTNTLSGNITIIGTNGILALVNAAGITNSPSISLQLGGILDGTARTGNTWTLQSGQTLGGTGVVRASLMNTVSGATLSPGGASALGTLTVTNTLSTNIQSTVTLVGTTVMELNRGSSPNSDQFVAPTNVFGGTLTVNNLGAAPILGDSFTLFPGGVNRGTFTVTNLPALTAGLLWNNTLGVNGKLTVVSGVNTSPTNITVSVSGNTLTLAWPADHIGWRLISQTNTLAVGLIPTTNAWFTVAGSASVNSVSITLNPTNPAVFYRMVYP